MRKAQKLLKKHKRALLSITLIILLVPILTLSGLLFYFRDKVYPQVFAVSIPLGGQTLSQATQTISQNATLPQTTTLSLKDQTYSLQTSSFASIDPQKTAQTALQAKTLSPRTISLTLNINQDELTRQLEEIKKNVNILPKEPSISLNGKQIKIFRGEPGETIDVESLKNKIISSLSMLNSSPIPISTQKIDPTLTEEEAQNAQKRAEKVLEKSLILTYENQTFTYKNQDILTLINPKSGFYTNQINSLSISIAQKLDRPPQEPKLSFTNGKITEFAPSLEGIKTNTDELASLIENTLTKLENEDNQTETIKIPATTTQSNLQTKDVNNLGIEKLIGEGLSYFRGSIASRIHNLTLASSRINGTLLAPGETFSFNTTVGDISKDTGYQEAYIIKDGRTILGDGGGVCQVSTTLFRSILNAGLPITERRAHAYRVGYYEQGFPVGLDATVYSPTTDFKFKNDTPGHILIQTQVDIKNSKLIFDIYGTDDGRVATIGKSIITEQTPPPEDIYQDDPSLPVGTTKQVDYKSWGAKVNFKYSVTRNGETIYQKTFYSNYQPWAAVYLVGTGPTQ